MHKDIYTVPNDTSLGGSVAWDPPGCLVQENTEFQVTVGLVFNKHLIREGGAPGNEWGIPGRQQG